MAMNPVPPHAPIQAHSSGPISPQQLQSYLQSLITAAPPTGVPGMADVLELAQSVATTGATPILTSDQLTAFSDFLLAAGHYVALADPTLFNSLAQNIAWVRNHLPTPPASITALQAFDTFHQIDTALATAGAATNFCPMPDTLTDLIQQMATNPNSELSTLLGITALAQSTGSPDIPSGFTNFQFTSSQASAMCQLAQTLSALVDYYPPSPENTQITNSLQILEQKINPQACFGQALLDWTTQMDALPGLSLLPHPSSLSSDVKGQFMATWIQNTDAFIEVSAGGLCWPNFPIFVTGFCADLTTLCNQLGLTQTQPIQSAVAALTQEANLYDPYNRQDPINAKAVQQAIYNFNKLVTAFGDL